MSETAHPSRTGRWAILTVVAVAVVVGVWSGGWVYLRSEVAARMDVELPRLKEARGIAVVCPERGISGWPFRVDIDCRAPSVEFAEPSAHLAVAGLRVAALVYQPDRIVLEADGPLAADGPHGETVKASWLLLQASIGLNGRRPERFSIASDALSAAVSPAGGAENRLTADHAEIHLRPAADAAPASTDYDVVARLDGVALFRADKALGPSGSNLAVAAVARHVPTARPAGTPPLKLWAEGGGTLDIRSLHWTIGGFAVDGTGTLSADDGGQLNGSMRLVATGLESLLFSGSSLKGKAEVMAVASAFTLLGKPADGPSGRGRALDIVVDQGAVKVGSTTLTHLPRLF